MERPPTGVPLSPDGTAVLVIDMQQDFCDRSGALAARGANLDAIRGIIQPLATFLSQARRTGVRIVHVQTIRHPEDISPPLHALWQRLGVTRPACVAATSGVEIVPELRPQTGDPVVTKTRYSAFVGTNLETLLRNLGITTIVPTGVATNVCVESTWRHGFMLDFFVVVPEDLVASSDNGAHVAALENLTRYFGQTSQSEHLLAKWTASIPHL
jgi:ureidoacrylate peracid hydrolase